MSERERCNAILDSFTDAQIVNAARGVLTVTVIKVDNRGDVYKG